MRSKAEPSIAERSIVKLYPIVAKRSKVKTRIARNSKAHYSKVFLKINNIMNHQRAITVSRQRKLVPDDKFDRHMKRARVQTIENRKQIFNDQTEEDVERRQRRRKLQSSIY